ncbi:MAG: 4-hydroxy-tetrahydrodipicolinate reductase [Proteobacteria bacterium]|nr:4-hydroxy-tetrahydrodipicolinate reductase [Pseudomonadota bacterium]MBU1594696.1 4-hydroxy-tetrahydrodipicolinate reductase [Pseudomonadota bacterium]
MSCDVIIMGGCGRMGGTLIRLAQQDPELEVRAVVERAERLDELENLDCVVSSDLEEVLAKTPRAVVVEFTSPEATVEHVRECRKHGNPMVIGTTGLKPDQAEFVAAAAKDIPILLAPNMSVGVNVLLKVLPQLVQMLGSAYDMEMVEIHHGRKKDSPSGTALKLAQCMAEARGWVYDEVKRHSRDGIIGERPQNELGVLAVRGGDVVGDHTAYFFGPGERIEVTHRAHSRETFAQGALRAAKWLAKQQPGRLFGMADLF